MKKLENKYFSITVGDNGAMTALRLVDDPCNANFALATADEPWVPEEKQWGLGFFTVGHNRWQIGPCVDVKVDGDSLVSRYALHAYEPRFGVAWDGDRDFSRVDYKLMLTVTRTLREDVLEETFCLENQSLAYIVIDELGLYSSFHDTYVACDHALDTHMNQHFWMGGDLSYIEAQRQNGCGTHLGLITTEGNFTSYQVEELNSSNFRGVIAMMSKNLRVAPGGQWTASRVIVPFKDREEFEEKICAFTGYPILDYGDLTVVKGEAFRFRVLKKGTLDHIRIGAAAMTADGEYLTCTPDALGEYKGRVYFGNGKIANLRLRVIEPVADLLRKRAHFIADHQQMNDPADPRYGAFMLYDNEREQIIRVEDIERRFYSIPDRNCVRERIGMGAFLAAYARIYHDDSLLPALRRYAEFLEKYDIDENYDVWDSYERQKGNLYHRHAYLYGREDEPGVVQQDMRYRTFNYVFMLAFTTEMYWLTKELHFAELSANIMERYVEKYAIGGNTCMFGVDSNTVRVMRDAGMCERADKMLAYLKDRVTYLRKIDDRYDPSEVIYEQGTSASAMRELADYYLETGDESFLEALDKNRDRTLAFEGKQPDYRSYHAPTIHWDDFWFGGMEMWGDTMPHYWDTISADAYCMYAKISGEQKYVDYARYIFRNNLALIEPDGSCCNCFVYPEKVNGRPAGCLEPWANDQDWAFYTLLRAKELLEKD